jgi:Fanconi anemia group M protein
MARMLSIERNTDSSDAQVGGLIFLVWCDKVPMNAESNKIKDTFVEILIPLIGKLCDLGVFYTRDLARISPYELIMARDKFRQAPPDSLHQGQYREVECGFGGAITLCHILKLLHSHGIRPALEMLLSKLHQGYVYYPFLSN